ncbi:transposase, partial [Ferrovum myxofaciens]
YLENYQNQNLPTHFTDEPSFMVGSLRFCVWSKRLEQGRFFSDWSQIRSCETDWTHLKLLLEGVEPKSFRKRFSRVPTA